MESSSCDGRRLSVGDDASGAQSSPDEAPDLSQAQRLSDMLPETWRLLGNDEATALEPVISFTCEH